MRERHGLFRREPYELTPVEWQRGRLPCPPWHISLIAVLNGYSNDKRVYSASERGIGTVRYPRLVARDEAFAAELARRTLTNLYNERPAWLDLAHRRLDDAVFAAYDWPADLADDELLSRLLALNHERAESEQT